MDTDIISYESMLAARDSAEWAYWGMWASVISAFTTFFATLTAIYTITSWRKQEALKEKKDFVLSVVRFQKTIGLGPKMYDLNSVPLNDSTHPFWSITYALLQIYESSVIMTARKDRDAASRIYLLLDDVYESLHQSRIDSYAAVQKILLIRDDSFFNNF